MVQPGTGSNRLRDNHLHPSPTHFPSSDPNFVLAMQRHGEAVRHNKSGYVDPATGRFVFTAISLAQRPCCGSRCRHCPWQW